MEPQYVTIDSMGYPDIPFDGDGSEEVVMTVTPDPDYLSKIGEKYRTKARWNKAVNSLEGSLEGRADDIGLIKVQVWQDILEQQGEELAELVLSWANEQIKNSAFDGIDQWYKRELGIAA